jgi:cytochrome P450
VTEDAIGFFEALREQGSLAHCNIPFLGDSYVVHRREDVKAVLAADGDTLRMSPLIETVAPYFGTRGVMSLDGPRHIERRRVLLPAFHGAALGAMQDELRTLARETVRAWPAGENELLPLTQALTFSAILQVAFGIRDPERAAAAGARLRAHFVAAGRGDVKDAGPVQDLLQEFLDERRAAPERPDFLGLLLAARSDGGALDDATLRDEVLTTLTAGHETTATALAFAVSLLAHEPGLVAELRAGDAALMDATVHELLRIRPPLLGVTRIAERDTDLPAGRIPAGECVTVSSILVHHDPARYASPSSFEPRRFLGVRPSSVDWLPFGAGPHRCAGAAFAALELRIVLEELLAARDIVAVRDPSPAALRVNTLQPSDGAVVCLA